MKRAVTTVAAVALASCIAIPAWSNDSTAELSTGGLVFVQNADVQMRSEDLSISAEEIRVRYEFVNAAAKDVTVLVAFPMPEIRIEHQDQNIAIPTDDPLNILAFATSVNGRPVTAKVEQRVIAAGIDRTQLLRDLGIPLAPHLAATGAALDRLPADRWAELQRLGLAEVDEYDAGKGTERHLSPRWGLSTTYYWEQTFPAGATVTVEHRYKPSLGVSVGTMLGSAATAKEPEVAAYLRKYCIDGDFTAAIDRARRAARVDYPPFTEQRIDYILKTGANWSGPIGRFRLVVDKGDADSLISFCGDGVRKTGPTRFEMVKTDFIPQGNLSILIMKRIRQ